MRVNDAGASFTPDFPLQRTGSLGSVRSVNAIPGFGFEPLAFRYLALTANYHLRQLVSSRSMRPGGREGVSPRGSCAHAANERIAARG